MTLIADLLILKLLEFEENDHVSNRHVLWSNLLHLQYQNLRQA